MMNGLNEVHPFSEAFEGARIQPSIDNPPIDHVIIDSHITFD